MFSLQGLYQVTLACSMWQLNPAIPQSPGKHEEPACVRWELSFMAACKIKTGELRQTVCLEIFDRYLRNICIGSVEIKLLRLSLMPP